MWIELPWPENPANTCTWHTETLDSCFTLGLISRSNQQPQNTEPKLLPPIHIAWLINLNVSCKLYLYTLQRTWSPPGPRLPRKIGNTHPRNYYNLKGKDINVHLFSFLSRGIILWIEFHDQKIRWTLGLISNGGEYSIYCWWDLIKSKQLSSVSVCCAQVFAGFSGHGNSIHNIITLLKENVHRRHLKLKWNLTETLVSQWEWKKKKKKIEVVLK